MKRKTLHYAAIQTCSGTTSWDNLDVTLALIDEAAGAGVDMAGLPECVNFLQLSRKEALKTACHEEQDESLRALCERAEKHAIWIHIGSLTLKAEESRGEYLINCGFLINSAGKIVARYQKIHLFDVSPGDGREYRESALFLPGEKSVLADTPWGGYGMSICYDLRFPRLYQTLAGAGATILSVPAAFTVPTGRAHWEILLRARAIENTCFLVAPAQSGLHQDGRKTWGHSMIIDPEGEILACREKEGPGIITAKLDMEKLALTRRKIPNLEHGRDFTPPGQKQSAI